MLTQTAKLLALAAGLAGLRPSKAAAQQTSLRVEAHVVDGRAAHEARDSAAALLRRPPLSAGGSADTRLASVRVAGPGDRDASAPRRIVVVEFLRN